MIRPAWTARSC